MTVRPRLWIEPGTPDSSYISLCTPLIIWSLMINVRTMIMQINKRHQCPNVLSKQLRGSLFNVAFKIRECVLNIASALISHADCFINKKGIYVYYNSATPCTNAFGNSAMRKEL